MQSEESNTLVKLAKAVIEHAPEGGDAFWDIKFSDIEAALSAAEPVSSRNDEAGYVEFLNHDVPYIVRDIQGAVAILMDLETRNVIGYRVYDPDSVFAPQPPTDRYKPLQSENSTKPIAWVYAADLEKGDGCFGDVKGEVIMGRGGNWVKADTPLYAAPPAPSVAVKADENPMRFFSSNVDNWGALEWFNRMADACEDHDRKRRIISQCTDDEEKEILEISANTSKMVMTSSAFHLARECKDSVISALSAQVQDVAGWQLVPKEPTGGMIVAGYGHLSKLYEQPATTGTKIRETAIESYRAMLAAAPAKQEGGHD